MEHCAGTGDMRGQLGFVERASVADTDVPVRLAGAGKS
jgi:hypothetical protein